MFGETERKIQWFCSETQFTDNAGTAIPYGLAETTEDTAHFAEFKVACTEDSECPAATDDTEYKCTNIMWDAVEEGTSWANGAACYNDAACPAEDEYAKKNENYANTGSFSYYTQFECTDDEVVATEEEETDADSALMMQASAIISATMIAAMM